MLPPTLRKMLRGWVGNTVCIVGEAIDRDSRQRRVAARDFFTGQSIALVGPSPSIVGMGQGQQIDQYDLIARLNSALPLDPNTAADIGSRCEVLFSSLFVDRGNKLDPGVPIDSEGWLNQGVKQLICAYPRWYPALRQNIDSYLASDPGRLPLAWASRAAHRAQSRQLGGYRPTTGYAAIRFLLDQPIKELFVTGFTFMRDGYQKQYRDISVEQSQKVVKTIGVHDPERELQDLRRLVAADTRIKIDPVLQKIFDAEPPL